MKQMILLVHPMILVDICKYGTEKVKIIKDAIPKDCKYIRAFTNDQSGQGNIGLVIESESFSELKEGDIIPIILSPTFEKIHVNN